MVLVVSALAIYYLPPELTEHPIYHYSILVVALVLIVGWYKSDAKDRGVETSRGLDLAVIFFAVFAIPYYRIKYTGFSNGARFVGKIIGLFLLCMFIFIIMTVAIEIILGREI